METHLPLHALVEFNEVDYGVDENKPEEQVVNRIGKETLKAWDQDAIVPPGWNIDVSALKKTWKNFAIKILDQYTGKIILVVTSNGIARFSGCLTGDFEQFKNTHKLKISTGALCIFENDGSSQNWDCVGWNILPKNV